MALVVSWRGAGGLRLDRRLAGAFLHAGNFARHTESYGALPGVVMPLSGMWLSAYAILTGTKQAEAAARTRPAGW